MINLLGQRFGRLVVIRIAGLRSRAAAWWCRCDCGVESIVLGGNLRSGGSTSCGCFKIEIQTTHGHEAGGRKSPEYAAWDAMIQRCENPKNQGFRYYGARGIKVCDRWRKFENFISDMGRRPPGRSIDRINNDGNYEPGNCRWASNKRYLGRKLKREREQSTKGEA